MALAYYFHLFAIFFQISNHALVRAQEPSNDAIVELGVGVGGLLLNSDYTNNVKALLFNLTTQSSLSFYNTSTGDVSDRAYGYFLCRGDLSAENCNNCLNDVMQYVSNRSIFGFYPDGIIYNTHLECVVHYSNNSRSFVYNENIPIKSIDYFGDGLARYPQYNTTLLNTLQELVQEVGYGNSTKANFASREVEVAGTQEQIYAIAQCTPDISAMNCSSCIRDLYIVPFSKGVRLLGYYCLLTYNNESFVPNKNKNESFVSNGYPSYMTSYFYVILVLLLTRYFTFM